MLEKNVRGRVREGEKRNKKLKNENFSLQSKEFRRLEFVGPRMKVHLLDEGYMWVPKTWISPRIQARSSGNQRFLV